MRKYKKFFIPAIGLFGLLFALYMVFFGVKKTAVPEIEFPPPTPPYEYYVAGSGMVEACSRNIKIGVPFTNTVAEIYVKVGDIVKKNTPLFSLDTRTLEADRKRNIARKLVSEARYNKLIQMPRIEEVYPKEDIVLSTKNEYENQKLQFELFESVKDKRALSLNELNQRYFAYQISKYNYKRAEDELALLNTGAWIYDLNISKAEIVEAEETIKVIESDIQRSIIKAPIDGVVMQVNTKVGETVEIVLPETPSILFGCLDPLHIRVNVDETDAWKVQKNEPGTAFVRGNSSMKVDLEFLYIEPFIVPKQSFTGDNTERVDIRVLEVLYKFNKKNLPIYPGQIMDVFIRAKNPKEKKG